MIFQIYLLIFIMKKILIIDDDKLLINLLKRKLSNAGYEVIIATNGEEGIKKIREIIPDLILLDITMPVMNGYEVIEQMSKEDNIKNIPLVVISNSGEPVEIERIKKSGIVKDWIVKIKFDIDEVLAIIKKYI